MSNKLSQGGYRPARHAHPKLHHIVGQFTTAGAAAATGCKGMNIASIRRVGTGEYEVTLGRAFKEIVAVNAWLAQAAAGNDVAFPKLTNMSVGSARTGASFRIMTQSAAGTDANLTGPIVMFEVWASDVATPSTHISSTSA